MDGDYTQNYYGRPVAGNPSGASTAVPTPLRPSTPNTDGGRNPFADGPDSHSSHHRAQGSNPFASPNASRPASSFGSSSAMGTRFDGAQRYFHSRRVRKGEVQKPWLGKPDSREKWVTIIPVIGILVGLGLAGFLVWDGIRSVVQHKYCLVLEDDFSRGFNTDVWTKEVEVGGFGNGEFEQTTNTEENVFIENGILTIKPTLQDATLIDQNNVLDLRADGSCTGDTFKACVAATNLTNGNLTIVPPTRSGRINTRKGAKIKYGRVEVTAKMPQGDWLWPAIWLMPVTDTYGAWPASGEIDIMESRGNNYTYAQGGNDIFSSALHWGPDAGNDAWWRTNSKRRALHTTFSAEYHTFGLEWSQKYLFTYVNSRLLQAIYINFDEPMWKRGQFPQANANGTRIADVWSQTGRSNTPFDQYFYLILNVAVGGTNGWFEDKVHGKPWAGNHPNAKKDFWDARDQWFPTWTDPTMKVKKVTMWQQCDGDEGLNEL